MRFLIICSFIFCCFACNNETSTTSSTPNTPEESPSFSIEKTDNPSLIHENLQLFPIIADADFIANNNDISHFKSISEGMEIDRFRIVEKKPYGRFQDNGAVNSLTILNKSKDTIFLMAGDVVVGGNQDRVLAVDMIVPPRTVKDIEVFCVEKGRWFPRDEEGRAIDTEEMEQTEDNKKRKYFAFNGYYNVASKEVRKAVSYNKNQQEVWDKVAAITTNNGGETATGTYTGLEESSSFTQKRADYLRFFEGKFEDSENVIGVVAVRGNEILGTDIFAHPNLFKSKYEALLHSYVTDAINENGNANISKARLEFYEKDLIESFSGKKKSEDLKFYYNGKLIHFTKL